MPNMNWGKGDESGLTPSAVVGLGLRLQEGDIVSLMASDGGFVAAINGSAWDPYALLSELLEDLGFGDAPGEADCYEEEVSVAGAGYP